MSLLDLKHYISEMLIGLKCAHDRGIVHRDVKPGNFLYNRKTKMGYLGDFGLAQRSTHLEIHKPGQPITATDPIYTQPQDGPAGYFIHDRRKYISVDRSGTRSFRAPEIYLNSIRQTTAMDIWAVGVILISFLSNLYPYFDPEDSAAGIVELMTTFGVKQVHDFATFYGRNIKTNIPDMPEDPIDMDGLCKQFNGETVKKWDRNDYLLALDLTKSCLQLIDAKRPSAAEALKHPFLKEAMLTKSHN
ncbi:kinase-like domain-containing protein [Sporodiniella umbellata]|nr:kinase-like domain-containing protein [Sporodiniella umbellata]